MNIPKNKAKISNQERKWGSDRDRVRIRQQQQQKTKISTQLLSARCSSN